MHRCEFCDATFQARPQVKHPRACPACQGKRQRENEIAWRSANKGLYDNQYHRIQKLLRLKRLRELASRMRRLMEIGRNFLGDPFNLAGSEDLFFKFLASLGVRRLNKFWPDLKSMAFQ